MKPSKTASETTPLLQETRFELKSIASQSPKARAEQATQSMTPVKQNNQSSCAPNRQLSKTTQWLMKRLNCSWSQKNAALPINQPTTATPPPNTQPKPQATTNENGYSSTTNSDDKESKDAVVTTCGDQIKGMLYQ